MQSKVIFFIDGFNLYHSIDENPNLHQYKWLDLRKLVEKFVEKNEVIEDIYYFSALCTWNQEKATRHKILIKALENDNIKVVLGKFKKKFPQCRKCHQIYKTYEEKRTDVNIAVYLLKLAFLGNYDKAIILSGDTDLVPAIETVKQMFPKVKIGSLFPINRANKELKKVVDFRMKLEQESFTGCVYENQITLINGEILQCPTEWKFI